MFAMSGSEFELQEAVVALRRVLDSGAVGAGTRVAIEGTIRALQQEMG